MKHFEDVVGHEQIIGYLQDILYNNKISHAYIFHGEDGCGKNLLANIFSATLQCEAMDIDPCTHCKACLQASTGNHPDIIHITHEKSTIGVDDIRLQLNNDILIKPYSSKYKVYIIDEAEKMTESAQNALLKTLEEPPEYAVIILLTKNKDMFLPTILSRCVTIAFKAVEKEKIKQYLMEKYELPDYQAELSAVFSSGNLGRAIHYATLEDFIDKKERIIRILLSLDNLEFINLKDSIKELADGKSDILEYFDFMLLWFRDILLFKATQNANLVVYRDRIQDIHRQASKRSFEGIENIIQAINKAKIRLNANVNFELTIELLFMTIQDNC